MLDFGRLSTCLPSCSKADLHQNDVLIYNKGEWSDYFLSSLSSKRANAPYQAEVQHLLYME